MPELNKQKKSLSTVTLNRKLQCIKVEELILFNINK